MILNHDLIQMQGQMEANDDMNHGKLCLNGIQMEANDDGKMTERFRWKHHRLKILKPGGNCPQHWVTTRTNKMEMALMVDQKIASAKRSSRA